MSSSVISGLSLSRDRKLDLIGVLLIVLGIFTLFSLFSTQQGVINIAWLDLLGGIFGWGMYPVPLAFLAIGLWLLFRTFGERLPRLEAEQVVGIVLLYLALLILLHAMVEGNDFASRIEQARLGRGGGIIGAALLSLLIGAIGTGGTAVVMAAWVVIGLAFTLRISVPEMLTGSLRLTQRLFERLRGQETRLPTPATDHPTPSPPVVQQEMSSPMSSIATEPSIRVSMPASAEPVKTWTLPDVLQVLDKGIEGKADETFDRERARVIEETLLSFGAPAHVVEINRGPTITQFGVEPDFVEGRAGRRTKVKVSKISALADDLALALAASSIRVEAPVPGKGYVGIEVPNTEVSLVALRDVMESESYQKLSSRLRLGLGMDVSGTAVATDLTAMPHLLIAGTTGSGKSVCVNAIISSLLLQNTPDDLRFLMVDPKRVELTFYNGIPHLLAPVVVELDRVVSALQWVSREMNLRYERFAKEGLRNIADYNKRMQLEGQKPLPYLVVVIDELADLMIMAPDQTERVITRLAQLARATGIHLVIATQRPSVDVVTGLIKANFPARIAFAVASSVDSRVILDQPGAERLLGRGDMLFQSPDSAAPLRMQGAFVSEGELGRLITYWKSAAIMNEQPEASAMQPTETIPPGAELKQAAMWEGADSEDEDTDPRYDEAVEVVRSMRRASISLLQRRLRIGYTRAARLVDQMEERGIIGPAQGGSHAREVLDYSDLEPPDDRMTSEETL
jgi:S-DNA-T family DNA segregation ATPase FtsK/SpoIIIE